MDRCARWLLAALFALGIGVDEAAATIRFWSLQGVVLEDGAVVVGSFGFDDATGFPTSWNIHVQGSPDPALVPYVYLPYTYVPGNSTGGTNFATPGYPPGEILIGFHSDEGGDKTLSPFVDRLLNLTSTHLLDGTLSTVPLDLATPGLNGGLECMNCAFPRHVVSGSLVLTPFPPPVALVDVVEFHHAVFDHYFMSADAGEIAALDTGVFTGWARTGYSFKAYVAGSSASGSIHPVCRYYGLPSAGLDSHFYSASGHECIEVHLFFGDAWEIESDNKFQIALPDTTTGACPTGTIPVYRVFNSRRDANHRFTTSLAVRATMESAGWIREGYSAEGVVMCAVGP